MGFFDALLGRNVRKAANLDSLFTVPTAAITLQTALGLLPTGAGAVCFRSTEGRAAQATVEDAIAVLRTDDGSVPDVERSVDSFGYTWLLVKGTGDDVSGLVTDLHAVNTGLETQGFADGLLCSTVAFGDAGRRAALVYLYKQGTFYPFAPTGPQTRDGLLERQVRDAVAGDLPMEPDPSRWLPVWGAPGL